MELTMADAAVYLMWLSGFLFIISLIFIRIELPQASWGKKLFTILVFIMAGNILILFLPVLMRQERKSDIYDFIKWWFK